VPTTSHSRSNSPKAEGDNEVAACRFHSGLRSATMPSPGQVREREKSTLELAGSVPHPRFTTGEHLIIANLVLSDQEKKSGDH